MRRIIVDETGSSGATTHPYGRITNRIITRGMGPHINRLVTQGYGGPPGFVIQAILRGITVGQSGAKRRLREMKEVIIWAKMIEINNVSPKNKIEGFVRVHVKEGSVKAAVEHVSSRVRSITESIKVFVKHVK